VVGYLNASLLQIYRRVCQRKNCENRLLLGEVMGKSSASCFLLTRGVEWAGVLTTGRSGRRYPRSKDDAATTVGRRTQTCGRDIFSGKSLLRDPPGIVDARRRPAVTGRPSDGRAAGRPGGLIGLPGVAIEPGRDTRRRLGSVITCVFP